MRETIKYWLEPYVNKEELEGVTTFMYNIARSHSKTRFVIGFFGGMIFLGIFLKWLA